MIIVDWIMRPADSYWKRQWKAEEIRRKAAEADAKCFRDTNDQLVETRNVLSERDIKQAMAIAALNREIQRLKDELDAAQKTIEGKDKEILLLHEALRSERDLSAALRTNSKLWENIKAGVKEGNT